MCSCLEEVFGVGLGGRREEEVVEEEREEVEGEQEE